MNGLAQSAYQKRTLLISALPDSLDKSTAVLHAKLEQLGIDDSQQPVVPLKATKAWDMDGGFQTVAATSDIMRRALI